jgi:DNA-binding transcriptional MerR regulator
VRWFWSQQPGAARRCLVIFGLLWGYGLDGHLVLIGMMRDVGLTLDEVHGILHAATVTEWKSIASQRLAALDEQIAQLQHARELLAGALWCRFDHPATDCKIMGAEIDRRLDASGIP